MSLAGTCTHRISLCRCEQVRGIDHAPISEMIHAPRPRVSRGFRALVAALCLVLFSACDDDSPTSPSGTRDASDARGNWEGTFALDTCTGTGSVQDLTCRQRFPAGTTLLVILALSGTEDAPTGTLTLAEMSGQVAATVSSSGAVSLDGSVGDPAAKDEELTAEVTDWDTQLQNGRLVGTFSFRSTGRTLPGEAEVTATIRVLGRVD